MRARARTASALLLAGILPAARASEPEIAFRHGGDPVYRVLPPDRIPAISDPHFVKGSAAGAQMRADEPVLGIVLGGAARAYSLWQLDRHEIVNDRLAGRPITATW